MSPDRRLASGRDGKPIDYTRACPACGNRIGSHTPNAAIRCLVQLGVEPETRNAGSARSLSSEAGPTT